jgi:23S rRNA (guanosine2251-2'-O)-methyltransferase
MKRRFSGAQKSARSGSDQVPPRAARVGHRRDADKAVHIYGIHAAAAAIENPRRNIQAVWATANAAQRLDRALAMRGVAPQTVSVRDLDQMLGGGAVHQGVLVKAAPLDAMDIDDLPDHQPILILDQITDPHNVGAILRSAAAFSAAGLVMTERNSPPLEGALAKSASGGLEHVPVALVTNLATALSRLGERGILCIGLDSDAEAALEDEPAHERIALVLGAEDRGLRRLTRERCDRICSLGAPGAIRSLNVSNAAAIALHCTWQRRKALASGA